MLKKFLNITVANGLTPPDNMPIPNENKEIEIIVYIIIAIAILFLIYYFVLLFKKPSKTK